MLRIGSLQLETNLLLAPIAGYCDLAFRLIVRGIRGSCGGVGLSCTDLLCPQAVLKASTKTMWLAATSPRDRPLCMQLYGRHPSIMAEAAQWAQQHGAAVIDINMGCPVDKVTKKNGGSRLLCEPHLAVEIARQVVNAVRIPVTAKIRLGWDGRSLITHTLPPALADVGISALTVHGRTSEQKFRGCVRLDGIARVVEAMACRHPQVPVIGNGDIKSPQDVSAMINTTGCSGVMIGRGALGQPWIFRDAAHYLKTGLLPSPLSQVERACLVFDHFQHLLRLLGDERAVIHKIRQRISWYSPHLQPWPHLRRDVSVMKSVLQFEDYMADRIERLEAGQALVA